jgi:sugar-specific transcriptional regulator TrmB
MNEKEILEEIGFTRNESLVYLTLLKTGETKSGKIIKLTGLQSSVVHNSLNTLIEKGFVKYILKGKIKHYQGINPEVIKEYIKSKEKKFDGILPSLKSMQTAEKDLPTAEVYYGYNGLLTATLEMIKEKRSGAYKYFAAEENLITEDAINFFNKVDLIKKEKGIIVKGIANANSNLKNSKNSIIRYTSLNIPPAVNIYGDQILIMTLSEKPTGILIKSKEIANQYNKLWESIWKVSK